MTTKLTFESLPNAVETLLLEVRELRQIVQGRNSDAPNPQEELYDIKQAAEFLKISEQTLYQKGNSIPRRKRFGKLYFLRSELESYLSEGQVKPQKLSRNL